MIDVNQKVIYQDKLLSRIHDQLTVRVLPGNPEAEILPQAIEELPEILRQSQVDLLTFYRILRRRLNCVSHQPNLAKREVLRRDQ